MAPLVSWIDSTRGAIVPPPSPQVIVRKPAVPKPQAPVAQKPPEEPRRPGREGSGAGASADRTRGLLAARVQRTLLT